MDAKTIAERMQKIFTNRLVDPDVFPNQFLYQVKLAKYELEYEQWEKQRKQLNGENNGTV
jgi:hypothetical protein